MKKKLTAFYALLFAGISIFATIKYFDSDTEIEDCDKSKCVEEMVACIQRNGGNISIETSRLITQNLPRCSQDR